MKNWHLKLKRLGTVGNCVIQQQKQLLTYSIDITEKIYRDYVRGPYSRYSSRYFIGISKSFYKTRNGGERLIIFRYYSKMENRLKDLHSHERDDEQNGLYTSVSKILDHFYPFPELNGYMREQIVLGSKLHQDIDYFYNEVKYSNTNADFIQFINFAEYAKDILKIEPYRTEWKVYDDDFKLSGIIDMVFRKKNDPSIFYLYDWKRSKNQSDKDNNRYVVQLNLYKFILERNYGIKISSMYLVYFHPCITEYKVLHVAEKKVTKYLNFAMEWTYERERETKQHKTTRKRERELMDDSNPLKWMAGGNSVVGKRHRRYSVRSKTTKKRSSLRSRTKKRHLSPFQKPL